MKGYKTKLTHQMTEAFVNVIANVLNAKYEDDDDKLVMASLDQVRIKLLKKQLNYQLHYTITFTPAEAIALRILYTHFMPIELNQFTNRLRQLADEVHKQYSV